MSERLVIAIDGPSGTGKSSVARGIAQQLGLDYLDTGAMYRSLTWLALSQGIDVQDAASVGKVIPDSRLSVSTDPERQEFHVGDVDVTQAIRGPEVTEAVSVVAAIPEVRHFLVSMQQDIARRAVTGIVLEGRDIGNVVLPQADLKIYLTADESARAARRAGQVSDSIDQTRASLLARDLMDSTRAVSPLEVAPDALVVDTTSMTLNEVVEHIVALASERT